jgi:phage terminase large subunit
LTGVLEINLAVTNVFDRNYDNTKRIAINRGGTRSSKTYSLCQLAVHWLFTGEVSPEKFIDKGVWSIVRKTLPALRATAYRDIIEILADHGLYEFVHENKTERTITFGNRMIEFFSADDQQKVRSRKRQILHIPESNELRYYDFQQLAFRTTDYIYLDFNPDDINSWIKIKLEDERASVKGDVEVIISTYLDNRFLDSETISEIEYLQDTDPDLWAVFGQGIYGKIAGLIYPDYEVVPEYPVDKVEHDIYGLDFGFKNPMALVRCGVYDDELYLDEVYYKSDKTIPGMCAELPPIHGEKIYADSADPGRIQQMVNNGFRRCTPAYKGKGSVSYGIMQMKGYKMHVTARSVNLLRELRSYKWDRDKNDEATETPETWTKTSPIKLWDHALDAARYAVATHFYQQAGPPMARATKTRRKKIELR